MSDASAALRSRMWASDDLQYRNEGWAVVMEKAFDVARYAYGEIKSTLRTSIPAQLFEQDQEIDRLNAELGKLRKELRNDQSTD